MTSTSPAQPSPTGRKFKVAICQFQSVPAHVDDNLERNLKRMESFVQQAASEAAHLIVFPEYALTSVLADHTDQALDEGELMGGIKRMAKNHQIDIVAGTFVERSSDDSDSLYNTAFYVDKDGQVLGKYIKKNLWHPEKSYLTRGEDEHDVFDTAYFKAGFLICWDLAWPEAFRALFRQDVEVVIVPAYWVADDVGEEGAQYDPKAEGEQRWLDSLCVTRAYENECCVIFVNCGGKPEKGFIGRSTVTVPFKGALCRLETGDEAMKVVEVDLDILKAARSVYRMKEDLDSVER